MRVTDDRYRRERAHHDLALRMISHEARTCTIRAFTGLTDDRIRKLYRTYLGPRTSVRRRRGKSPRQAEFFTRNLAALLESSYLAAVLYANDVILPKVSQTTCPSLVLGWRFCEAYESFRASLPASRMSFEHAWCLVRLLSEASELTVARCAQCCSYHVADPVLRNKHACPLCRIRVTPLDQIPSVKQLLRS
jgi:hypothetical protein